jgi:predicted hotdog family 3-hydroxylacyl-ACP dehydratase
MCLLDRVEYWNDASIRCVASSHRQTDNPLRAFGRLAAACGIEYAAQAMAIHGALLLPDGAPPARGYLTSVRNVELHRARLDDIAADLLIRVERLSGDENSVLYEFSVSGAERLLLDGRASVVLNASTRRAIFPGA